MLLVAGSAASASAQTVNNMYADSLLSRWFAELNFTGGIAGQSLTLGNIGSNYNSSVNDTISGLKFKNGNSLGFDLQGGYFFGKKRHFGVSTGVVYFSQTGDVSLDKFHTEYKRTDDSGYVYRQVLYSNGQITEHLTVQNFNIPLLLKYRKRFNKLVSFNADAGLLFNLQMQNSYTTNATFNYEEIKALGLNGNPPTYDNGAVPSSTDVLLTQAAYFHTHPDATQQQMTAYFDALRSHGENVGINSAPSSTSGKVSYTSGTIGVLLRPTIGFHLSDNVMLNVGAFYAFQPFKTNTAGSYKLTDNVGQYNSLLNASNTQTTSTYGGSIGIRYYFGRNKDVDHDGVLNKLDRCPLDSGVVALLGCPDKDGDGIPDIDDSCATVPGIAKFNGCPDTDGDGIPDKLDACPNVPGLVQFKGCPDSDGDGIQDKDDPCPYQAGPAKFNGCPDTDGDGIPDNLDKCPNVAGPIENQGCPLDTVKPKAPETASVVIPDAAEKESGKGKKNPKHPKDDGSKRHGSSSSVSIADPVLFDLNKTEIKESAKPILQEAVKKINDKKDAYIVIEGYTDTTGPVSYNKVLSKLRANVLKKALMNMGVSEDRISTVGLGSSNPAADNSTHAGRMRNRRAEMKWAK